MAKWKQAELVQEQPKWMTAPEINLDTGEGQIIGMEETTPEEAEQRRLWNIEQKLEPQSQITLRAQEFLNRPKSPPGTIRTSIDDPVSISMQSSELNNWELMEVLAQTRSTPDALWYKRDREQALAELRRRNVPSELISTYVQLGEPTGFMAGLKADWPMIVGTGAASLTAAKRYPAHPLLAGMAAVAAVAPAISYGMEKAEQFLRPETARYGLEVGKEVTLDTLINTLAEPVSYGMGKGLVKVLHPFDTTSLKRGATELSEELKQAGKRIDVSKAPGALGISKELVENQVISASLTPAQKYANSAIGQLQSIAENSIVGRGRLFVKKKLQLAALGQKSKETLDSISVGLGSYTESVHNSISSFSKQMAEQFDAPTTVAFAVDQIQGAKTAWKAFYGEAFRALDNVPGVGKIQLGGMKKLASEVVEAMSPAKKGVVLNKRLDALISGYSPEHQQLVRKTFGALEDISGTMLGLEERKTLSGQLAVMADEITFEQAIALRSDLLQMGRTLEEAGVPKARRLVSQFVEEVDSAMEKVAQEAGIEKEWRRANELVRIGKDRFENDIIEMAVKKTVKENTQGAANRLMTDSDSIKRVNEALLGGAESKTSTQILENKIAHEQLKNLWISDQWLASMNEQGIIDGAMLKKRLDDFGHYNLSLLFPDHQIKNMYKIADMGILISGETPGNISTFVHMLQAGSVGSALSGHKMLTSMATFGFINGIGRIMSDDLMTKIFIEGVEDIVKYEGMIKSLGAQTARTIVGGVRGVDEQKRDALINQIYRKEGDLYTLLIRAKKMTIQEQKRLEALERRSQGQENKSRTIHAGAFPILVSQ